MLSLAVNYGTALAFSALVLILRPTGASLLSSIKNVTWASYGVGFAIVAIELGVLLAYRVGWKISVASAVSNVLTALVLVGVGPILFREHLTGRTILGITLCVCGLSLLAYEY
jgi:multidrug transporter EmrE-like cation transporter